MIWARTDGWTGDAARLTLGLPAPPRRSQIWQTLCDGAPAASTHKLVSPTHWEAD